MNPHLPANAVYNSVLDHWAYGAFSVVFSLRAKEVPLSRAQEIALWETTLHQFGQWVLDFQEMKGRDLPGVREQPSSRLRQQVFERDEFTCLNCGQVGGDLHADHVLPVFHGGETSLENLQTLCAVCNMSKGTDAVRYVS